VQSIARDKNAASHTSLQNRPREDKQMQKPEQTPFSALKPDY